MFKRVICLILFTSFIFCGCLKKKEPLNDLQAVMKRGSIIVGVKSDSPPFGFKDANGNLTGYDVELAHMVAKYLFGDESKVDFVSVTPRDRIGKLYAGDVDMIIATMSITPNRSQIVDFSHPYHVAGQAVMVPKNSKIQTIRDLNKKKVIVVYGTIGEEALRMNVSEAALMGYKTYPEAFEALKSGKADAMIADDTMLLPYAMKDSSVKILPKRYSKEPYAIAFRKEEAAVPLREKIDIFMVEMVKSGKMHQLCNKWGVD